LYLVSKEGNAAYDKEGNAAYDKEGNAAYDQEHFVLLKPK
jgi:hypothetical protein